MPASHPAQTIRDYLQQGSGALTFQIPRLLQKIDEPKVLEELIDEHPDLKPDAARFCPAGPEVLIEQLDDPMADGRVAEKLVENPALTPDQADRIARWLETRRHQCERWSEPHRALKEIWVQFFHAGWQPPNSVRDQILEAWKKNQTKTGGARGLEWFVLKNTASLSAQQLASMIDSLPGWDNLVLKAINRHPGTDDKLRQHMYKWATQKVDKLESESIDGEANILFKVFIHGQQSRQTPWIRKKLIERARKPQHIFTMLRYARPGEVDTLVQQLCEQREPGPALNRMLDYIEHHQEATFLQHISPKGWLPFLTSDDPEVRQEVIRLAGLDSEVQPAKSTEVQEKSSSPPGRPEPWTLDELKEKLQACASPQEQYEVACAQIRKDQQLAEAVLEEQEIRELAEAEGKTVAHAAAYFHASAAMKALQKPDIWKLTSQYGTAVVHVAVFNHEEVAYQVLEMPEAREFTPTPETMSSPAHWVLEHYPEAGREALKFARANNDRQLIGLLAQEQPLWLCQQLEDHPTTWTTNMLEPLLGHPNQDLRRAALRAAGRPVERGDSRKQQR